MGCCPRGRLPISDIRRKETAERKENDGRYLNRQNTQGEIDAQTSTTMRLFKRNSHIDVNSMEYWRFTTPRLIKRNLSFHQSKSEVNIQNVAGKHLRKPLHKLYRHDWFHLFLRWPTFLSVFVLLSIWTAVTLFFGAMYVAHDRAMKNDMCSLWPSSETSPPPPVYFFTAFTFALETATTVGYALPGDESFVIYLLHLLCGYFSK